MNIYCDGVFDLFHNGHYKHLEKIKKEYPNSFFIVGIVSDKDISNYKRVPKWDINKRSKMVESCKYVDKIIQNCLLIITEEFMLDNKIDLVIHAFSNKDDSDKQSEFYKIPIQLNKFRLIEYNVGISTTQIINEWHKIWEKKGNSEDLNLSSLAGWENTDYDFNIISNDLYHKLDINKNDKILEIGCGSGLFSKYFDNKCDYYGIDYAESIINKNIFFNNSTVFCCEANSLPFKDTFFDKIFCIGVFEYFPNTEYMNMVLKEIERVSKNVSIIYIIGIRHTTRSQKCDKHKYNGIFTHTIYKQNDFPEFTIVDSVFGKD